MFRLSKAKYFTVLDASSGFWQLRLDEASSGLCTFNTPFGRFRLKRLFEGIEGAETYIDDLLIWGETKAQRNYRLRRVLERARVKNFKLNKANRLKQ